MTSMTDFPWPDGHDPAWWAKASAWLDQRLAVAEAAGYDRGVRAVRDQLAFVLRETTQAEPKKDTQ